MFSTTGFDRGCVLYPREGLLSTVGKGRWLCGLHVVRGKAWVVWCGGGYVSVILRHGRQISWHERSSSEEQGRQGLCVIGAGKACTSVMQEGILSCEFKFRMNSFPGFHHHYRVLLLLSGEYACLVAVELHLLCGFLGCVPAVAYVIICLVNLVIHFRDLLLISIWLLYSVSFALFSIPLYVLIGPDMLCWLTCQSLYTYIPCLM